MNIFVLSLLIIFQSIWASPTERFVLNNPIEEIKYNLRLDNVTFEYKAVYDKAISQEGSGFFGYHGASSEFRVYQDLIRLVFEEVLKINVPEEFHFLAVPLARRPIQLEEIGRSAFEGNLADVKKHLFPINLSLYGNYKRMGFCPIRNFHQGLETTNKEDLYWLFSELGLDQKIIEKAFQVGRDYFKEGNHLLLQFFDRSDRSPYEFIDKIAYPSWPSGHPFENRALSDYLLNDSLQLPPQVFLLLDRALLDPKCPLQIKRYSKIQPTKLKAYEQQLRDLIRTASYDENLRDKYVQSFLLD